MCTTVPPPELPTTAALPKLPKERPFRLATFLAVLAVAVALTVAGYLVLGAVRGPSYARQMAAAGAASILGLGTTVILGGAVLEQTRFQGLAPWDLALLVAYLNTVLAVVYGWGFELLERLPKVGPALRRTRAEAHATIAERPWIRRFAVVGIGLFVLSPLPGSGVLGGSIVGRIIGLGRLSTLAAVSVANALVCVIYAEGADVLRDWFQRHEVTLAWRVSGLVGAGLVFLVLIRFLRGARRSHPFPPPGAASPAAVPAGREPPTGPN